MRLVAAIRLAAASRVMEPGMEVSLKNLRRLVRPV